MKLTLVRKELAEHWLAIALVGAVVGLLFSMVALAAIASDGKPAFEVFRRHLLVSTPLAAWFLGGRLVRLEYGGRTQLFLDALPLRRSWVVSAKYAVGGAALVAYVVPPFLLCAVAASRAHDVSAGLLWNMSVRGAAYVWLVHAACFALGFLGRYRTVIVLAALFCLAIVLGHSDVEMSRFGPFGLLDETYAFERDELPVALVLQCCGAAVAFTLVAYGFAALHEGSVAARLAQQMSLREKAFMAIVLMAVVFGTWLHNEKRTKSPFAPSVAAELESDGLRTVIGAGSRMTGEEAAALASSVHGRIDGLRTYLGIAELPPLFVFGRTGLDASRFEHGEIEDEEGIVVRVGHPSPGWDEDAFIAWLAVHVLTEHSDGRARSEDRRWVLDGFGPFWAGNARAAEPLDSDEKLLLRALYGAPDGVTRGDLDRWETLRDRVGDPIAAAIAWSGLRVLVIRHGADAARAFLREALATKVPGDFRAVLGGGAPAIADSIERHAGVSLDAFLVEWNAELAAARERHLETLADLPRLAGEVSVVSSSDNTRELDYVATLDPVPSTAARVRLEWLELAPFHAEFDEEGVETDDVTFVDAGRGRRLPHTFRSGARVAWRLAHRADALGCAVISPVRRTVLE